MISSSSLPIKPSSPACGLEPEYGNLGLGDTEIFLSDWLMICSLLTIFSPADVRGHLYGNMFGEEMFSETSIMATSLTPNKCFQVGAYDR